MGIEALERVANSCLRDLPPGMQAEVSRVSVATEGPWEVIVRVAKPVAEEVRLEVPLEGDPTGAVVRIVFGWAAARRRAALEPHEHVRDVVRRYNYGARSMGRGKGGSGEHLWDAHVRELIEVLRTFEPSTLPRFIQPGLNVPMVVAATFPLCEAPLLEALLAHGADPNEAMHYPLSLDIQGPLGGPSNTRESFATGATALDILERAEALLATLDAAGPAKGGVPTVAREDARRQLPVLRGLLERFGARRGDVKYERPVPPLALQPILEAFELLADLAGVARDELYRATATLSPQGIGPWGWFAEVARARHGLDTPALRARLGDHPVARFVNGGAQTELLALYAYAEACDAPTNAPLHRFLPIGSWPPDARKLLAQSAVDVVGGTLEQGLYAVKKGKKGTHFYRVGEAGVEELTNDFAAWLLDEVKKKLG